MKNALKIYIFFIFCFFSSYLESKEINLLKLDKETFESIHPSQRFKQYTFGLEAPIHDEREKIEWILENKDSQIKQIVEGKIYLRPESIIHSDFGVFLRVQNFLIVKLSNLRSDEMGFYIPLIE